MKFPTKVEHPKYPIDMFAYTCGCGGVQHFHSHATGCDDCPCEAYVEISECAECHQPMRANLSISSRDAADYGDRWQTYSKPDICEECDGQSRVQILKIA